MRGEAPPIGGFALLWCLSWLVVGRSAAFRGIPVFCPAVVWLPAGTEPGPPPSQSHPPTPPPPVPPVPPAAAPTETVPSNTTPASPPQAPNTQPNQSSTMIGLLRWRPIFVCFTLIKEHTLYLCIIHNSPFFDSLFDDFLYHKKFSNIPSPRSEHLKNTWC